MTVTGYLAADGFLPQLQAELTGIAAVHGRLVLAAGGPQPAAWAQNIWYEPRTLAISSIADGAAKLTAMTRNWWPYAFTLHRRMALLQERLPHVGAKPLAFPDAAPAAPLGSFTLLDSGTMLASPACSSPFPNGEPAFVEDKDGPPSRAYLKLYEAFTLFGRRPGPGDTCLDLGASPGGWTWVLARLGATVTAYDRADLAPHVASLPNVTVVKGDAFSARPDRVGPVDWLFSDVICYPEKLLEHVRSWLAAGACRNLLVTLKFQGTEHYGAIQGFREVPGGKLVHLGCNKHELTWAKFTD